MNAPTDFTHEPLATHAGFRLDTPSLDAQEAAAAGRAPRSDGWTPDRQRTFLAAIADGHTVGEACMLCDMSSAAAYAFRRRPAGAAFALGWRSAALLSRESLADTLLDRALNGSLESITKPDGAVITRHRLNDRLAMQLLTRLDRQVEGETPGDLAAAKLVAGDFDAYLDLLASDAGPARAALFLTGRSDTAELEPIAALARADRRRREGLAAGEDLADLDPADRHGWTAEQWARAEAAGLVALAPCSPLSQLNPDKDPAEAAAAAAAERIAARHAAEFAIIPAVAREGADCPVWYCPLLDEWRTDFPLPDDAYAEEDGEFGDPDYSRQLTEDEQEIMDRPTITQRTELARALIEDAAARDEWFADVAATKELPDPVAGEGQGDVPTTANPTTANPTTANPATANPATANPATADHPAHVQAEAPRVPANAGTQGPATTAVDPETSALNPAGVAPATVDLSAVASATLIPATDTLSAHTPTVRPEEASSAAERPSRRTDESEAAAA